MRDPKVFLFDEPLSNLDAALRVATRLEIARLKESLPDATMIYVTHDQVEAMTLADRIVVLNSGRVEQVGTPMQLYHDPQSLFVAGFIGSPKMNLLTGVFAERYPAHTLGVRPEHVQIRDDGIWNGRIIHAENLGSDSYLYIDAGAGEPIVTRQPGGAAYVSGQEIHFSPEAGAIYRFDELGRPIARG